MRILEIELKGHKRFSLNKIETIKITPRNKFHWILGTNGSGKTSLMKELSPLPGIPNNYHKGGHKKMLIEDNKGITYRLISDFSGPKNLFHFIMLTDKGEEELNVGHTSTVFTNLVFQKFNITKEIHELAIGTRNFDMMGPGDRKQLLTKLSDTDFSFALGYFQKLLTAYRDMLGSIKTDQNRLTEARIKLISPEEERLLIEDIATLKERSRSLMEICPNPSTPASVVKQRMADLQLQMVQATKAFRQRLSREKYLLPLGKFEDVVTEIRGCELTIGMSEHNSRKSFTKLEEVNKKLKTFQLVHATDEATVLKDMNATSMEILRVQNELITGIQVENPKLLIEHFDSWQRELEHIVHDLTPDPEGLITTDALKIATLEYQRGENFMVACRTRQDHIRLRIQEIKACEHDEKIECPKCNHRWVPGKSPEDLRKFQEELDTLVTKEQAADLKMAKVKQTAEEAEVHLKGLDFLNGFIWKYEMFKPFWELLLYENIPKKSPGRILSYVTSFKHDLATLKLLTDLENCLTDLKYKKELLENQGTVNITSLLSQQKELDAEIELNYDLRAKALKELYFFNQKKSLLEYINKAVVDNEAWQKKSEACFMDNFSHYERERLSDFILDTNAEIMAKEKLLRSVEIQKAQVEILQNNLTETIEFSKVMKAAVSELSPSEGLIAKGLTGFINHFVGLVNGIIRKVWLYPLELVPVLPDDDNNIELTYKFSVLVKGEKVPDLSECSSGQKEIINLAIVIVALVLLRLDHGPLFLDEFGARMDVAHKASAFEAVARLLSTSNFTQIFMISHFENSYSSNLESDITVLCPANLQLPPGLVYNQETTIN